MNSVRVRFDDFEKFWQRVEAAVRGLRPCRREEVELLFLKWWKRRWKINRNGEQLA